MAPRLADKSDDDGAEIPTSAEYTALLPKSQQDVATSPQAHLSKARRMLYLSHLFAQFSEVAWQFCLILFLAAFANYNSLILVSTYGLVSYGAICIFGAKAGRFVDGSNRLFVAQRFILSENCCVMIASLFCYLLLAKNEYDNDESNNHVAMPEPDNATGIVRWFAQRFDQVPLDPWSIVLLLGIHILGATASILDKGFLVAMERDWIVVMSQYAAYSRVDINDPPTIDADSKKWLSDTNVAMKQIDLSCKVAAPAVAGFLLSAFDNNGKDGGRDLRWAAILVGAINAAALVVEYICTKQIYHMLPALAIQNQAAQPREEQPREDQSPKASSSSRILPSSMKIYLDQSISMGGVSLALLYLNVLSFGGIMTAYLVWRGMRLDSIGVWRGISSAVGLMGTCAYHASVKRTNLVNTGMWSITYQFACLTMSYVSLFIEDYTLSLTLLILGVCSSRIGLWVFDIAITQLMQEHIPDGIRGVVGGVQQALQAFFTLLSFALGIVFPDPKEFYIYVAVGYACVGLALILYAIKIYANKDHFLFVDH